MQTFKDLETGRLNLTHIDRKGLLEFHSYSKDRRLYKYMEYKPPQTLSDSSKQLEKFLARDALDNAHYWWVRLAIRDTIIGSFGVTDIDWRKKDAEIGYAISPRYWNNGYFKEVLKGVLDYLFKERKFHRIWAKTQYNNIPSIKGLESLGFKKEGTLREFYYSYNKKRKDAIIFGILRREYEKE